MTAQNTKIITIIVIVLIVAFAAYGFFVSGVFFPGRATLKWNANTEPNIAGYKIYYGTTPRTGDCPRGGYTKIIDVNNNTNYTVDKLRNNQTYYFSVTSYNSAKKESCFSQEMSKTIKITWRDFLNKFKK